MASLLDQWQNWRIHQQNERYIRRETQPRYDRIEKKWLIANTQRSTFEQGGYLDILRGLGHFLDYVEELSSPTILDVGTGTGRAIRQLRESPYGRTHRFIGTGLIDSPETIDNLGGRHNFRKTSGEFLDGIADTSIGGIIGVYSITHSKFGSKIAHQFDRVLVEGGAIKVNYNDLNTLSRKAFVRTLRQLGYDVAIASRPQGTETLPESCSYLVVAIKHRKGDRPSTMTAKELMEHDMADCEYQNEVYLRRN